MDQRLYNSAKSGDILHCKQLLNENPSLLLKLTPHENTPFHIATQFGHKNIVAEIYNRQQSLLAQPNLDGDTPLHVAARANRISIVGFLIEEMLSSSCKDIVNRGNRGIAILRMRNKWGNTVLHEAVRNHNLRVAEFLIKVDPGLACFENNTGESPLYLAARDGMLTIVKRILMAACSSAYGGSDGQTALHATIVEGHSEIQAPEEEAGGDVVEGGEDESGEVADGAPEFGPDRGFEAEVGGLWESGEAVAPPWKAEERGGLGQ
ncbi:hypothetical protein HYC85_014747 [Camellia sinensis]|uniref:PGG domain-containing protein n=1 Tax=Camellia sinensis TaxID=4442 RepID=A0A7J7H788_CAMSI|nr:hypothetical protein HYC85_014747 [Camellia sinensis]